MDDRRDFIKKHFPKWSGFCVHAYEKIQPAEALQNLQYLVEGMSFYSTRTSKGYFNRNKVDEKKLELSKVGH